MKVFLSPAQHHKKCLVNGCSEAIHCNMIVDAMEPYLDACGIEWLRNDKTTEAPMDHVRKANAWGADLYLALHTNAGGGKRCTFYNSGSVLSQEYSYVFADHFREVYPNLVKPNKEYPPEVCEANWTELTRSEAPAVYAEQWFHDNDADCTWGHEHIQETAKSHVKAICEIFGIPFVDIGEEPVEKDPAVLPEYDGVTLEEVARVVAAESRGEPYEGQMAVAQCIRDRWEDPGLRFGKTMPYVLGGFAAPWGGDLSTTTCMKATEAVFGGESVFNQPCLWCLGHKAKQETFDDRNAKYVFLGQIGQQWFWGDEKDKEVPVEYRDLGMGDTGDDVTALQLQLMQLGYDLMEYGADGIFGGETLDAVKGFQTDAGLVVDGIVGVNTRKALAEAYDQPKTYIVRKGDTLVKIARAHGTTAEALAKLNNLENPALIHPGQVLKVEV